MENMKMTARQYLLFSPLTPRFACGCFISKICVHGIIQTFEFSQKHVILLVSRCYLQMLDDVAIAGAVVYVGDEGVTVAIVEEGTTEKVISKAT